MTITLGKRKRAHPSHRIEQSSDSSEDDREGLQDIFRRAFEKKFKPLPTDDRAKRRIQLQTSQPLYTSQDETDWEGVDSEEEHDAAVEVVEVSDIHNTEEVSKSELKAFMVCHVLNPVSFAVNRADLFRSEVDHHSRHPHPQLLHRRSLPQRMSAKMRRRSLSISRMIWHYIA